ncbi:MAG: Rieske 2Fe-2S domain-containing protein [Gemmatimonadota bacterium]|nr:Rieske 2Fe-2S domain-containing protein [Gemmatimonadota bacterium]
MTDESKMGGCDSCVSRRDFLGRVALVAGAFIAAGCAPASDFTGVSSGPPAGGPITLRVSDYAGLATVGQPVEIRTATGSGSGIAAVRTSATSFIALGMACTHQGTKVNIVGQSFDCPNHGARFNNMGAVTLGPANRALESRPVAYDEAAGTLTVS